MRSLAAALPRGGWRRYANFILVAAAAVVTYAWIDLTYSLPWNPDRPRPLTFSAAPLTHTCDNVAPPAAAPDTSAPIPNIVHYIWLLADPAVFTLSFKVFVSVYSTHLFLHPDTIYFHTDVSPALWERTKTAGDAWTRRVLALPHVTPLFIENPGRTKAGRPIDTFGAKSDFIRADALRKHGGVYLDVDAVPLRDLAPLRRAGFASVVGGATALAPKHTGFVNTGVWLARPHAILAEIFYEAMDAYYNGVWAISVSILTDLAYRLHAMPGEVLIVNPRAFAPFSWELADQVRLFQPHRGASRDDAPKAKPGEGNTCASALEWLQEREREGRLETWEEDFSATYVLHAFDDYADKIWGWDGKITLPYVLARQSNYARAVYPAISHAIQAGIIPLEETL